MGARIHNNPKTQNLGYVDHTLALDIRELRKKGFVVEGRQKRGRIPTPLVPAGLSFIVDLVKPGDPHVLIDVPGAKGHQQFIGFVSGISPRLIRWALTMIRLAAACRNTSVNRATGRRREPMISPRTCPGPTDGN